MSHFEKEKQKLVARFKRIRGQVDSIERSLTTGDDCAELLMLDTPAQAHLLPDLPRSLLHELWLTAKVEASELTLDEFSTAIYSAGTKFIKRACALISAASKTAFDTSIRPGFTSKPNVGA
jgi:DNA-binding FrmR family transcriptional regulator